MFRSLLSYIFVREFLVQDVLYLQTRWRGGGGGGKRVQDMDLMLTSWHKWHARRKPMSPPVKKALGV